MRILVAEDDRAISGAVKKRLQAENCIVDVCDNGRDAYDYIRMTDYDVILMDIQMPIMDGYEAAKRIRAMEDQKKAEIPIVAVTANAFEEDRKIALEAGMNGHLAKPYNIDAIMQTLSEILNLKCTISIHKT